MNWKEYDIHQGLEKCKDKKIDKIYQDYIQEETTHEIERHFLSLKNN